jgi:hypothetical protein
MNVQASTEETSVLPNCRFLVAVGRPGNYMCWISLFSEYETINGFIAEYRKSYPEGLAEVTITPFRHWFKAKEVYLISDSI